MLPLLINQQNISFALHEVHSSFNHTNTVRSVSFDNLKLPAAAIVSLYNHSLVESPNSEAIPEPALEPTAKIIADNSSSESLGYQYIGGNNKKVCLLVMGSENEAMNDKQMEFLTKMMAACKMTINDIAIVDHTKQAIEIKLLKQQLTPEKVILFGMSSLEIGLPVNFPLYKSQQYDGSTFLGSSSLEALIQETEEGKLLKSKLWLCLRQLFGV